MIIEGSQQWQHAIFGVAAFFILYNVWRGWRLGVVRGVLRLAALFCAWIGGSGAAGVTATVMTFFTRQPPLLAPAIIGLGVGLAIYLVISLISRMLFKTTGEHEGMVRFGFGFCGAIFGVIYGLLFLWAGITLIRGMGACGELRAVQARNDNRSLETEKVALALIKLKASLELGVTGQTLKQADPLPSSFYDNIVKLSMIGGDQVTLERFFQYPKTQEVLKNPKIAAILRDPALEKASQSRNILPLLRNKNFQAAASDPKVLEELRDFDLTAALNFALEPPALKRQHGKTVPAASPNSLPVPEPVKTTPTLIPPAP